MIFLELNPNYEFVYKTALILNKLSINKGYHSCFV
ncbi:hypothetical protein Fleli_0564 [Bernardetia litoralis DSM 6794]|uniref:Uncharacterized protein n=1 Tax=Bernardetia litoralis (strain ATCC 23117 / DSM 6794 / NBRC 15988 / NCIMB 1366 / Fx l1 / Sio-4) TaxID=880071 RepID=I4AGE6_BERLS|nr:hypothetical protein Fleli_0564 [Bernardetia litoralis DSM 6794]